MTIEKAIALLKAGRYNEVEYLEAKNMAIKALKKQAAKAVGEPDLQTDMWKTTICDCNCGETSCCYNETLSHEVIK